MVVRSYLHQQCEPLPRRREPVSNTRTLLVGVFSNVYSNQRYAVIRRGSHCWTRHVPLGIVCDVWDTCDVHPVPLDDSLIALPDRRRGIGEIDECLSPFCRDGLRCAVLRGAYALARKRGARGSLKKLICRGTA